MAKSRDTSKEPKAPSVTLVEDPYGIKTLEISESQNSNEELDLGDELLEEEIADSGILAVQSVQEMEDDLSRMAAAVADQMAKDEVELKELAPSAEDQAEAAKARLEAEIAEDLALEQQMAKEAEEAAEIDPELQAALPKPPVADAEGNLDLREMESCLEALLFMMDKPVSAKKLQELLGPEISLNIFQEALTTLSDRYAAMQHGIELVQVAGGYQFRTKPGRSALAKKLAKIQTQRLSTGAMESLAVVAYRQPVMKDDIDKVRGVDSSHFIRGLLDKKLIRISGRSELPGRPMLYETTQEFLELFGLKDLAAMPPLRELEQMAQSAQLRPESEDDPRVKEMRRLVGEMKSDTSTRLVYDPKEDEKFLKDIRERVNAIPTSSPYLDEQKAAEKAAKEGLKAPTLSDVPEGLPIEGPTPEELARMMVQESSNSVESEDETETPSQ